MSEPEAGSDLAALRTSGPPRRRRVGHQRAEDLDQLRRRRRLLLPDLPHVSGRPAAPGHQRDHRADVDAGHRGPPDHRHDDEPPLLRGLLHRRAGARRQPRRRRGQRVQADDAPARARAGRHRPAGVEPSAVPARRSNEPTRPTRSCARRSPRIETGYRIGRILVIREVLRSGARRASRRRRSASAPSTKWRVAQFVARMLGAGGDAVERRHPRPRLRARLHDHGRHVEHHAQHPRRAGARPARESHAECGRRRRWSARRAEPGLHLRTRELTNGKLEPSATTSSPARPDRRSSAVTAAGCITDDGRRILDAAGGAMVANIGHGRTVVADAVREALDGGAYVVPIWSTPHRRAAARPCSSNGGCRPGWATCSSPAAAASRRTRQCAWRGRTTSPRGGRTGGRSSGAIPATTGSRWARWPPAATALAGPATSRSCSTCRRCRGTTPTPLVETIEREDPATIAAFLFEPITGAAGACLMASDEYWRDRRGRSAGATTSCSSPTR